jgi:ADP-ribose pyrophosphatase YjhB (NUDIX family)
MAIFGVNTCIIKNGKILLTRREDFEVWCLPGGAVDDGEPIAHAALRETREEIGLEVELTRLIGLYSQLSLPSFVWHIASFAARPVGGELRPDPSEVLEIAYFAPDELPDDLMITHRRRIQDAFADLPETVVWTQQLDSPFPSGTTRADIYRMRDESGLPRSEYYRQTMGRDGSIREIREV